MRVHKLIFLLTSVSVSTLFALDLPEALQRGFEASHRLGQSQFQKEYSQALLDKANSSYLPKINTGYALNMIDQDSPDVDTETSVFNLELSYNLFNGYADKYGIESAKYAVDVSEFEKRALQADIRLEIELAYIDVLEKQKSLLVASEAVELVEKSLKDTQAYYDQGLVAKNAVLETNVSLSNAKQSLLEAKSALRISRQRLSRLLAYKLQNSENLEEISMPKLDISKDILIDTALKNRPELLALNASLEAIKSIYMASQSYKYPKIDLSISHERYGEDGDLSGREIYYDTQNSAQISFSYNLYDGGANQAQQLAYLLQSKGINEGLQALKLDIALQVKEAKESYELALQNRQVAIDTREFAQENFEIVSKRYKAQLEKTTDFLNARLQLSEAKTGYTKSIYKVFSEYVKLQRAVGKIL